MSTDIDLRLAQARQQYLDDGAALLRDAIEPEWIEKLAAGTERLLAAGEGEGAQEFSRPGEGRFFGGLFSWFTVDEYKDFIMNSNIGYLAAELLQAETVRFFYDQPLIKEPGTPKRTPWHHDYPYWPTTGEHVLSIWVPLDSASPENGVVTYIKGSHKWNAFFPPENWSDNEKLPALPDMAQQDEAETNQRQTILDIKKHPENYDMLAYNVEPGDVLIHHSHTIHGAQGNLSVDKRRRAIALRFFGEKARWDDSRVHFLRIIKEKSPSFPYPELNTGDLIEAPIFPVIWPK